MVDLVALNTELLAAHATKDGAKIAHIYKQAGDDALDAGKIDTACFYFTHAYVFALESNCAELDDIHTILKKYGREE
ncbi:hypothetical protein GCM10008927_09270 [Amylibacter ulvae]|uniref:Uncharacterized protein n=1 Tax=Paramylibacter ulvae TaxID=1651968 RepID=A0ABQ3CWK8_9RHOB|nr:hypothetical protein [Amylibacter ulvae]GHA46199.1 hypothetical protein GCM10008927_09270 [Amylibacter ulvae]